MGCCFGEYPHCGKLGKPEKCNIILVSWCCMCKRDEETVDYLMLHCPIGRQLWGLVFKLVGAEWVMLRKVVKLLACWQGSFWVSLKL